MVTNHLGGTGNAVFSLMPVVVDVAKSSKYKPSAPLFFDGRFFTNRHYRLSCKCGCCVYEWCFGGLWMELSYLNRKIGLLPLSSLVWQPLSYDSLITPLDLVKILCIKKAFKGWFHLKIRVKFTRHR